MLDAGIEIVGAEPPTRFADRRPDAVLIASRNSGLIAGLVGGLAFGLGFGRASGWPPGWPRGRLLG